MLLKISNQIASIILLLACFFFLYKTFSYHLELINFPYPITYREGALISTTDALIKGLNPFALENEPEYSNHYGILYPIFSIPLAKFMGATMKTHRIMSCVFIIACASFLFFVMYRYKIHLILCLTGITLFYASMLFPPSITPCSDPAPTGLFFMLLTIFIPLIFNFYRISLIISLFCGILAFYSKPYFILGAPIIGSYIFLFISKKKGLFYGFSFLTLLSLSIITINNILPCYFNDTVFAYRNLFFRTSYLFEQLNWYSRINLGLILIFILYFCFFSFNLLKKLFNLSKTNLTQFIDIYRINNPLINKPIPLFLYAGIITFSILMISMGKQTGAVLWYFFHLLSPFLIMTCMWIANKSINWPIFYILFLFHNLLNITNNFDKRFFTDQNIIKSWKEIAQIISTKKNVLNNPLFAPILIEQNKTFYDNGMSSFFVSGGNRDGFLIKNLFTNDNKIIEQQKRFISKSNQMLINKEYDLVLVRPDDLPDNFDVIQKFYRLVGKFYVIAPQDRQPYLITIWIP